MVRSPRLREASINQRIESAIRRSGRTSTGTWYEAPPTRRLFTSTAGFTFSTAVWKTSKGSSPLVFSEIKSSAPYRICSAVLFFPPYISELIKRVTSLSPYFASGIVGRLRSEEHTSELQSRGHLVCRLL